MKEPKIKNFTQELSSIEKFESFKKQKIIIDNCEGQAYITKSKKEFNPANVRVTIFKSYALFV